MKLDARTILWICNKGRECSDILLPVHSVDWDIEADHNQDMNPYLWQPNPCVELSVWKSDAFPNPSFTIEGCGFKFSFSENEAKTIIEFLTESLLNNNKKQQSTTEE